MNQELLCGRWIDPAPRRRVETSFVEAPHRSVRTRDIKAKLMGKLPHGHRLGRAEQLQQHNHVLALQHVRIVSCFDT
jgi:hypothetical protein